MRRGQWRLIWLLWLLIPVIALPLGSFIVLESLAWNSGLTLSAVTADLPKPWVFALGWVVGGLTCGLCIHF